MSFKKFNLKNPDNKAGKALNSKICSTYIPRDNKWQLSKIIFVNSKGLTTRKTQGKEFSRAVTIIPSLLKTNTTEEIFNAVGFEKKHLSKDRVVKLCKLMI
ncbi:hypothetical protein [Nostoc sphaeroides]|uniref:Uncharacterized protein n=1 Tax=Nostoc sphaeroides CCNUC1 TaxID=2653204 RepID=A0A5P8WC00_9NOSO|nr:hypothetical protein [Nostoc sphaeroides]MCC5632363.1 hypothetical protein [Nostoc sphaeroides CHAB 2801]QFS50353.1 hypothetical protein GXM_07847 [Nostoc sphaeroides CCNUC1]